jgi:predicted DNA-binding antitoxin AbrB/MazE fold protein
VSQRLTAIYRNGALFPLQPLTLPEESAVEIEIADSQGNLSLLTDPGDRERMWQQIFERWDRHPVNGVAGRYTRDELHERR